MNSSINKPLSVRFTTAVKSAIRPALKTAWWMIRLTVIVSFVVTVLQYVGVIAWVSHLLNPFFSLVGLPGEASLVFITGYFVNIYSAIAAIVTLEFSVRAITILAVMCLCAHNMIIETAVQKKTGSSAVRMVVLRTLAAMVAAVVLNQLLPASTEIFHNHAEVVHKTLGQTFVSWILSTGKLVARMLVFILSLNILQRLLAEFGVIRLLSKGLRPALKMFGLPARTSFLWIVANVLGLAYGAAVMIEETEAGKVNKEDADLLNHHIAISHSNLEDVGLFLSVHAALWWMLIPRWIMAAIAVWLRRLELRYVAWRANSKLSKNQTIV